MNTPGHGAQGVTPEAQHGQTPQTPGRDRGRRSAGILSAEDDGVRAGQRNRRQPTGLTTEVEEGTETKVSEPSSHWPPIAHITEEVPVVEGSLALCGAKLMGIELNDAHEVCAECIKIYKQQEGI